MTTTLEDASAVQRNEAADVLTAVADPASTGTVGTTETGQTFAGLARKLEELEARLQHLGRGGTAVAVKRAPDQIEARPPDPAAHENGPTDPGRPAVTHDLAVAAIHATESARDPAAAHEIRGVEDEATSPPAAGQTESSGSTEERYGSSGQSPLGNRRVRQPIGHPPGTEFDAAIRNLTVRMAAAHREALRRGAWVAGGSATHRTALRSALPFMDQGLDSALEIGAASDASTVRASSETSSGLSALLRRLEAKVDTLARKVDAEAASVVDRHQADLLARRIETAELQLTKRLDSGFAAAAAETRGVEDMIRALAARCDTRGDLGGALATLERSVGSIRDRLDQFEEPISTETTRNRSPARQSSTADAARDEADRQIEAALAAIRDSIAGITERLQRIEAHLSNPPRGIAGTAARERAPSAHLPWSERRTKLGGSDRGKDPAEGFTSTLDSDRGKTRSSVSDPEADIPIEPGIGFTPPLQPRDPGASHISGLAGDEGGNSRTDFIDAACRAVRAGPRRVDPHATDGAPTPADSLEGLAAKAKRLARTVRWSIFRG